MTKTKKKTTDELAQISVPTKKITLEISEEEKTEVILRPFKQRHFAQAIALIHKYFDSYNSVNIDYVNRRKEILDKYEDENLRAEALLTLEETFEPGIEIAKAVLQDAGGEIGEDIKTIVDFSIYKATKITTVDGGRERSLVDLDLDELTWGECLVLLGSTIGLNMDFFAQNTAAMNLTEIIKEDTAKPKQPPKAGEKSLAA